MLERGYSKADYYIYHLEFVLYNLSRFLDLKNLSIILPDEFKGYYNDEEYSKSQKYLKKNTVFSPQNEKSFQNIMGFLKIRHYCIYTKYIFLQV